MLKKERMSDVKNQKMILIVFQELHQGASRRASVQLEVVSGQKMAAIDDRQSNDSLQSSRPLSFGAFSHRSLASQQVQLLNAVPFQPSIGGMSAELCSNKNNKMRKRRQP